MPRTRRQPVAKRWRYMKLFLVWHWGTREEAESGTTCGIYAVQAVNREDCAQLLLREKVMPTPGQDTTDVLKRIREQVARAETRKLYGKFECSKIVDAFENDWTDKI